MYQVAAYRVAPMHVAPVPAIRIVLVEKVIFPFEINQAIRVIQPSAPRSEMELRTERLPVQVVRILDLSALIYRTQPLGVIGKPVYFHRDRLASVRSRIKERPPVRRGIRQFDIKAMLFPAIHR